MRASKVGAGGLIYLCLISTFLVAGLTGKNSWLCPSDLASDESGTEVILGKTQRMVFVSADSKISGLEGPEKTIDGERKLVKIGSHSACAIESYLGKLSENLDVAASIREWVSSHPDVEIPSAMPGILKAAALVWDKQKKRPIACLVDDELTA